MNTQRRNALRVLSGLCGAAALPRLALAQPGSYPDGPVTVIVPYGAGGSTDVIARLLVNDVSERLGGNFIVENKPGAAGNIGTRQVGISPPDGKTLLYSTATPFCINPYVYRTLPFDPDHDFAAVSRTAKLPLVLVTNAGLGVKTADELVQYIRKNPSKCSFSSYGVGTSSHIAGAIFCKKIGASEVLHVPYKDMTAMSDLAAGRNTFHIDAWSVVDPLVKAGKLVPLAVSSGEPLPWAPQLPTIASVVKDNYEVVTWHAVFAPRKTPADIVDLLHKEFQQTIDKPAVQKTYTDQGFLTYPPATPKEIDAFVKQDKLRWKGYVEAAGITPS
ncbi:tripartite tricarboxylate transporter substrate binding protein [Bordetella sp. BOR01]|uniref:Bug family tripartite tricarboxylate transporter substrate binding protein n=1 Tax=Bordetella sp. BOR01 TaxID=2854779 RepID=UPI001C448B2E|nr:tripartite tricarboxylate transporter substrate binding protein [Bordetella sp. BOR01]MBV7481830.1 tripartite tricarboxylate transporter substrate binding protein [Bordetella sp. BOR01]